MNTTLSQAIEQYELGHEVTSDYVYQLNYAVSRLNRFLGRESSVADLNNDTVNRWLKHERDSAEIGDRSRANIRTSILTVWKFSRGDLNRERIRSVIVTPKNPEAWYYDELNLVAKAAGQLEGKLKNGIARSLFMSTSLWFAYETGLRRKDIWKFDIRLLDGNHRASLTQHKTKRVHLVEITDETFEGMQRIQLQLTQKGDPNSHRPLMWPQGVSAFYYWMKKCRIAAGVDPDTRNRAFQHVRRTGCTQCEVEGQRGYRYLGHSREGLDRKAYTDQRKTVAPTTPRSNRSQFNERSKQRTPAMH